MNPASAAWFETVNARARSQALPLLQGWFPAGHREGREFRCGDLAGAPGKSFAVNLESGVWTDFSGASKGGGDLISLVAAIRGLKQGDAANALGRELGLDPPRLKAVKDAWEPITPIPAGLEPSPSWWPDGTPGAGWLYTDAEGRGLIWRVRFDLPDGKKDVRPLAWCRNSQTGATEWRWKDLPTPRSLYNLAALARNLTARVLVVEGEKTAEAAGGLLPSWVVITWPGGAKRVATADWTPLRGREVLIWADCDDPGKRAAIEIAEILEKLNGQNSRARS